MNKNTKITIALSLASLFTVAFILMSKKCNCDCCKGPEQKADKNNNINEQNLKGKKD